MYEYADAALSYLNKRFIELFSHIKSLLSFDEANVLRSVNDLYRQLYEVTVEIFCQVAIQAFEEALGIDASFIDRAWIEAILSDFDPVTKYVFTNEVERKAARLTEALIAGQGQISDVDSALRYWSDMVAQYAITVTDHATLEAYRERGIKYVEWVTKLDGHQCSVCDERAGRIYPIEEIPPKPHWKCRCETRPATGGSR